MGLGVSLVLMAIGAILRWAISVTTAGVNIHTVGLILLVVGAIGFVISVFWMVFYAEHVARQSDPGAGGYPQPPA
ncbi:hypothetical protein [Conexibacter sp. S30A1]|uniref:hypothetical protein n=1 Tax=Conexibacter sp. S30A1 TaxID=2937800 RepID=UPI00200C1496|nr:hypothetical protein [Conexibacter sp. S30A1]